MNEPLWIEIMPGVWLGVPGVPLEDQDWWQYAPTEVEAEDVGY